MKPLPRDGAGKVPGPFSGGDAPDGAEGVLPPEERAVFRARDRERIGRWAENLAVRFLRSRGLEILGRNVRERFSEIDVVCRQGDELVFVEVRCRRWNAPVSALESVGPLKWRRLLRGAELYAAAAEWTGGRRIDLAAVDVDTAAWRWRLRWFKYLEMEGGEEYGR